MLRIADAGDTRISRPQDGLGCAPTTPRRLLQALGFFASPRPIGRRRRADCAAALPPRRLPPCRAAAGGDFLLLQTLFALRRILRYDKHRLPMKGGRPR